MASARCTWRRLRRGALSGFGEVHLAASPRLTSGLTRVRYLLHRDALLRLADEAGLEPIEMQSLADATPSGGGFGGAHGRVLGAAEAEVAGLYFCFAFRKRSPVGAQAAGGPVSGGPMSGGSVSGGPVSSPVGAEPGAHSAAPAGAPGASAGAPGASAFAFARGGTGGGAAGPDGAAGPRPGDALFADAGSFCEAFFHVKPTPEACIQQRCLRPAGSCCSGKVRACCTFRCTPAVTLLGLRCASPVDLPCISPGDCAACAPLDGPTRRRGGEAALPRQVRRRSSAKCTR